MEKLKLRQRFLAGVLAMSISGATTSALALQTTNNYEGETTTIEQSIGNNNKTAIDEQKDFYSYSSGGFRWAYKYIDSIGQEKYITSLEPTLGDYIRTNEKIDFETFLDKQLYLTYSPSDFEQISNIYMLYGMPKKPCIFPAKNDIGAQQIVNNFYEDDNQKPYYLAGCVVIEPQIQKMLSDLCLSYSIYSAYWLVDGHKFFSKDVYNYAFFKVEIKDGKYIITEKVFEDLEDYYNNHIEEYPYMSIGGYAVSNNYEALGTFEMDIDKPKVLVNKKVEK